MSDVIEKHHAPLGVPSDLDTINELIATLGDHNGLVRQRARHSLVAIGKPAVPALIETLTSPDSHHRWEAAKTLGQIQDPSAAPALVQAMEDKDFGVRWLAAEGLIKLERKGLESVLKALSEHLRSAWIREGAHHVCRMLAATDLHDVVAPVLAALDGDELIRVPQAAQAALDVLAQQGK